MVRIFHRTRAALLRVVIQWGLTHTGGWMREGAIPGTVRTLSLVLDADLLQQVRAAAGTHGVTVAAWMRQALRQVTAKDFPANWRAGEVGPRSHDSRTYGQRFMLRLDETTTRPLETLVARCGRSRAAVIRQRIAHATRDDFPRSWQMGEPDHT